MGLLKEFKPTYLYVKIHLGTGKLYFGKTIRNVLTYKGSGKLWNRHINKHGRHLVFTLWYQLFDNEQEIIEFAKEFSEANDIVNSENWANLCNESGHGISEKHLFQLKNQKLRLGIKHTEESKAKMSKIKMGNRNNKGLRHTQDTKDKLSILNRNKSPGKRSPETRAKMSIAQKGNQKALGSKRSPEQIINYKKAWEKRRVNKEDQVYNF